MSNEMRKAMVRELINEQIEDTYKRWSNNPTDLKCYEWGWRDEYTLCAKHHTVFHCCQKAIEILNALEVTWYLGVDETEEGEPTPSIKIAL